MNENIPVVNGTWLRFINGLKSDDPAGFIHGLRETGELKLLLPEVDALWGVPQVEKHHPEIDTGEHILLCLEQARRVNASSVIRWAVLLHDVGKGITPLDQLPKHHGHEETGVPLILEINKRLKVPTVYANLALAVCQHHLFCHRAKQLSGSGLRRRLYQLRAMSSPRRFEIILEACEIDARGRLGKQDCEYDSKRYLMGAVKVMGDACGWKPEYDQDRLSVSAMQDLISKQVHALNKYVKEQTLTLT